MNKIEINLRSLFSDLITEKFYNDRSLKEYCMSYKNKLQISAVIVTYNEG